MEFVIPKLLAIVTALCTQLSLSVFLAGAVPLRSLNVPITPVNAAEGHLKGSSRTTLHTRVMEVSLKR